MGVLRVLVVSPPCLRAVNRDVYRRLRDRGFDVTIVAPASVEVMGTSIPHDPVQDHDPPIHFLRRVGNNPRFQKFLNLRSLVKKIKPDFVFLESDPASRQTIELGLQQSFSGRKLVCLSCDNMHRTVRTEIRNGLKPAIRASVVWMLLALARPLIAHVFCISSDIRDVMEKRGLGSRSSVIPLGFPHELFKIDDRQRRVTRARLEIGPEELVIGYFGRISRAKGVDLLVEALKAVTDLPWRFLVDRFAICQDSFAEEIAKKLEAPSLKGRVVMFDAAHAEMPSFMNCADIAVLPSVSTSTGKEQYGRVIPEAMACGCCAVVSDCGALPELVNIFGIITPEGQIQNLAEAIREMACNIDKRKRLSEQGADFARRCMSSETQAEKIAQTLQQISLR